MKIRGQPVKVISSPYKSIKAGKRGRLVYMGPPLDVRVVEDPVWEALRVEVGEESRLFRDWEVESEG